MCDPKCEELQITIKLIKLIGLNVVTDGKLNHK